MSESEFRATRIMRNGNVLVVFYADEGGSVTFVHDPKFGSIVPRKNTFGALSSDEGPEVERRMTLLHHALTIAERRFTGLPTNTP